MRRIEYKYLVAAVYVVALFMDLLDTTVVNVALPTFARDFRAGTTGIEWVITGYLLSLAVFIPVSGWAGDRFGTKRTFLLALGIFTGGSLLCSLSPNLLCLIGSRVLQGVGGGMLTPVGAAMLYRVFRPDERARVSSILTVPAVLAPASGPLIGGWLLQTFGWRSVFWVNIPIGLAGLVAAFLFLREQRETSPGRFDPAGFALAAVGLASLLYALAQAGEHGFSGAVIPFGLIGLSTLVAFIAVELRTSQPMIELRLLRDPLFRLGNAVQFFGFGAQFGTLFLLPLLLQAERGLTPLQSGLTTFPQAIGVMTMAPVAGRIYGRIGPRRMTVFGLTLAGATTLGLLRVDLQTNLWWLRLLMLARGWGFALSLTSMQAATFAVIRSQSMGRGSALYSVTRQVGVSLTVALLATVLSSALLANGAAIGNPLTRAATVPAFHIAFFVAALIALVGAALALMVDDRLAADTMQRLRPAAPAGNAEAQPLVRPA
jgi:EmrB/QacA subfamily drug resistance transporter